MTILDTENFDINIAIKYKIIIYRYGIFNYLIRNNGKWMTCNSDRMR